MFESVLFCSKFELFLEHSASIIPVIVARATVFHLFVQSLLPLTLPNYTTMPGIHDQPAPTVYHVPQLPPDEDAARYITDLFARGGDHTTVLLPQGASYNLYSMILLKGHYQELATEGYPDDNVLKARLFTRGKDEAGALRGVNKRYQAVRNV